MDNLFKSGQPTVSGGVFLVGLGMLLLTGWWWPGIMLVVGAAAATDLFLQGKALPALGAFALFTGIPLGIAIVSATHIPWGWLGAFILIGLGVVTLARSATGHAE
ncbi:MAG: hypothetical protein WCI67_04035 [Chloroflexales bacterium]